MQQNENTFDIYEHVTSLIISLLEKGVVPWRKPWREAGIPMNLISRRYYTGVNFLLLNSLDYDLQYYLTFNQIKSAGGRIKAGETGNFIVFQKKIEIPDKIDSTKMLSRFVLRYYKVFNIAQCANIPLDLLPAKQKTYLHNPIGVCELVIDDMPHPPAIQHKENRAYYVPSLDYINMPKLESFEKSAGYYSTLFHELIHATGHLSRLNRAEVMEGAEFGSELYSIEELIGEIGACFLNEYCGISQEVLANNAAYISSWLEKLKGDKKFVVKASFRAQKAVDYILNVK